ncbi:MAG: NAD(P)H dehydrogenase [Proteobacteria bacterium]|nr:MAG: NAD(P)H dehydrogenase [Pseudomonadota bacterium]
MHFLSKEPKNSTSVTGFKSTFCLRSTKNVGVLDAAAAFAHGRCIKTTFTRDNACVAIQSGQAMSRVHVLYAHSAPHASRVNRRMIAAARSLPNVTVSELYELYPDFVIDVRREQALLSEAELIVMQHPIQWYGMPSLQKEWLDQVLEHGWAYGKSGNMLEGKGFLLALTTGGGTGAYSAEGEHGYPLEAFLPPYRQTAILCRMRWLAPLVLHGARHADEAAVDAHVETYRRLLEGSLASHPTSL